MYSLGARGDSGSAFESTVSELLILVDSHCVGIWNKEPPNVRKFRIICANIRNIRHSYMYTSIITAVQNDHAVQWYRGVRKAKSYELDETTVMLTGGIELVDARGVVEVDAEIESLKGEQKGAVVLCVPAAENNFALYRDCLDKMKKEHIPHLVLVYFASQTESATKALEALGLSSDKAIFMAPYSENNTYFNETTNRQALRVLTSAIHEAERCYEAYHAVGPPPQIVPQIEGKQGRPPPCLPIGRLAATSLGILATFLIGFPRTLLLLDKSENF